MLFKNVRKITRWVFSTVEEIQLNGRTPILLGYSMGGDIVQRVAYRKGVDVISLSTPIATQYTFFSALDMLLKGGGASRRMFKDCYGISLSESFSFHIPRPDRECHITIGGVYSHFAVNNAEVIQVVIDKIREISASTPGCLQPPRIRFKFSGAEAEWPEMELSHLTYKTSGRESHSISSLP